MGRRASTIVVFIAGFMALTMIAAWADSVSGGGQTAQSAALGFSVHSNLQGELNYNADPHGPNAGFSAHCSTWYSYVQKVTNGFPMVIVEGLCTDKDGNTLFINAGFIDEGTPGTNDIVCIRFYDSNHNLIIHDHGNLTAGNITIHQDPNNSSGSVAEMLSS